MRTVLRQKSGLAIAAVKDYVASISPKNRKKIIWGSVAFVVLQTYFVRELIAAELLFGLVFAVLFVIAGTCYLVGEIGERSLDWAEVGVRVVSTTARRGYTLFEDFSKKLNRHPHSESAQ